MGCGNGRDTIYFAKNNTVLGIDQAAPEGEHFLRTTIEDFIEKPYPVDVLYLRFVLHAVEEETQRQLLVWGHENAKAVYIECRSDKGVVPDMTHARRLINSKELREQCEGMGYEITYFAEGQGFSPYKDEDPWLIRLHLLSKKFQ